MELHLCYSVAAQGLLMVRAPAIDEQGIARARLHVCLPVLAVVWWFGVVRTHWASDV